MNCYGIHSARCNNSSSLSHCLSLISILMFAHSKWGCDTVWLYAVRTHCKRRQRDRRRRAVGMQRAKMITIWKTITLYERQFTENVSWILCNTTTRARARFKEGKLCIGSSISYFRYDDNTVSNHTSQNPFCWTANSCIRNKQTHSKYNANQTLVHSCRYRCLHVSLSKANHPQTKFWSRVIHLEQYINNLIAQTSINQ